MKTIFLTAFAILATLATIHALRCGPCNSRCTPTYKLGCKGGLTYGICRCCAVCAKIKGEKCGGIWNMEGTCDRGLICIKKGSSISPSSYSRTGVCVAE